MEYGAFYVMCPRASSQYVTPLPVTLRTATELMRGLRISAFYAISRFGVWRGCGGGGLLGNSTKLLKSLQLLGL